VQSNQPYRVLLMGINERLREIQQTLTSNEEVGFEFDLIDGDKLKGNQHMGVAGDVLVIGPELQTPIQTAGRLRHGTPGIQIVFLVEPTRLDQLRSSLPYAPQLSDAWTVEADAPTESVSVIIVKAAQEARRRKAAVIFRDRINAQLSSKVAVEARRVRQMLLSEKYLATIMRQAPDPIFALSPEGIIISWNDAATRLFGLATDDAIGRPAIQLFATDGREAVNELCNQALKGDTLVQREASIVSIDGKAIYAEVSIAPIRGERDDIASLVVMARDITERKQTEDALQTIRRELARVTHLTAMGTMAASIAHEIKQPLGAIVANGSAGMRWLRAAEPNLDEARAIFKRIVDDGHRAGDIIASVRAMFEKVQRVKTRVKLNDLIREVLALVQGDLKRQGVALYRDLHQDLPEVMGDRVQLQQVVINLITNAIEAMSVVVDRQRSLSVNSDIQPSGDLLIKVEDTGMGIDQKDMDRIFDAFFTTKTHGMGMGLAICRSIVEAHNGRLWASSGIKTGSVFNIQLPAVKSEGE
jgi:PAS domain S-box-containing protein